MFAKVGHGSMLLAKALACHVAGQGRGMTCLPRPGHGMMLAKALACHVAGQGCGMTCLPRLWHGMLAKADVPLPPQRAATRHIPCLAMEFQCHKPSDGMCQAPA
ncbi:hypothetical protein ACSBR2_019770 [Camellia fascicularis]